MNTGIVLVGKSFYSETSDFVKFAICEKDSEGHMNFYFIASKIPEVRVMDDKVILGLHDTFKGFNSYKEIQDYAKNNTGVKSIYIDEKIWEKIQPILSFLKK